MQDKRGNEIEIESKVYVGDSYGYILEIRSETNEVIVKVDDDNERVYDSCDVLIIEDSIYNNLESINKAIIEAKTDIAWSDDDNTITILEEKINNLEEEQEEILEDLEEEYGDE